MGDWWVKYEGSVPGAGVFYPEENWIELESVHSNRLATYRFHNPSPKGIILVLHGLHLASNYSGHIAKKFYLEGYTVVSLDFEGHGKSEGVRGDIISYNSFVDDCELYLIKTRSLYPGGTPVFVLGHSMGSSISALLALKRPDLVKGVIMFGPALGTNPNYESRLQRIVRFLNCCCCGSMNLNFDESFSSRNPYYPAYHKDNPDFYHGKLNVRSAVAILDGLERIESQLSTLDLPILVFQGGQDKITETQVNREFIRLCKSSDKEFVYYEDMYHGIFQEPEIPQILDKCIQWVNQRL
jgi:alpha-beta hydrolase superfamily lysophospholipase